MIILHYQNGRVALHYNDIAAIELHGYSINLISYNHARYYLYQDKVLENVQEVFDNLVEDISKSGVHTTIFVPRPGFKPER